MSELDYRDFDVEIRRAPEADQFIVHVIDAPVGRGTPGRLVLPFTTAELAARVQGLQDAILARGEARRADEAPPPDPIQETGRELWNALFAGAVGTAFESSRSHARAEGIGLRLKLRLDRDAAVLNALPWEYLYDATHDAYLATSTRTPIVRFVEIDYVDHTKKIDPPLRILGMAVTPKELRKLQVERERRELERALRPLIDAERVELQWVEGGTRRDLIRTLNEAEWHVFHFIGHGGFDATARNGAGEGVVVLLDDEGRAARMTASDLAGVLGDEESLRLAVLNSCDGARGNAEDGFSSTAGAIIQRGTPAVVAMQYQITDGAAREFSRSFYEGTAAGLPIEAAVAQGRSGIAGELEDSLEWGTPVLYTRAPDNVLFELPKAPAIVPRTGLRAKLGHWWGIVRNYPAVAAVAAVAVVLAVGVVLVLGGAKPAKAAIDVSAEEVRTNDSVIVTGKSFEPYDPVQFSIKDILVGFETADDQGSFRGQALIPVELTRTASRSTPMTLVAFGRRSKLTAERMITVTPGPVLASASLPPVGATEEPSATPAATTGPEPTVEPTVEPTLPPDGCVFGFVWREAFLGDRTCVTPDEHQQVQIDNRLASIRIDPFGPYGPDTCVVPYVWREIVPGDHVCVTPDERARVAEDNFLGPTRIDLRRQVILP